MRVLVNALSVNNLSGRHVLLGHISRLAFWTRGQHEYLVLFHKENSDLCRNLGANVEWLECPKITSKWIGRAAWELSRLEKVAREQRSEMLFLPSGTIVPGLSLPQVSLAQNPFALVDGLERNLAARVKGTFQRYNYRRAVHEAAMMIYNSEYMRQAYRKNAGFSEQASRVVFQAIDDITHEMAAQTREDIRRKHHQVLCVSAMAPHKNVETLVEAIGILRRECQIPAHLVIAGSWSSFGYRKRIESLIARRCLGDHVEVRGHVSRDELHQLYAESVVFSLMSRCESFGIPAVEAQAFGTPVVSSNCCAIPEICGNGGLYADPGDAGEVARLLGKLLACNSDWEELSEKARENASRFHWDRCSRGLLDMFNHV